MPVEKQNKTAWQFVEAVGIIYFSIAFFKLFLYTEMDIYYNSFSGKGDSYEKRK